MSDRAALSFGSFDTLSLAELRREERYWWQMVQDSTEGSSVQAIAERHRQRCVETMREKSADGP